MFTQQEISQMLHYIESNKENFSYYGAKKNFIMREKSIDYKLKAMQQAIFDVNSDKHKKFTQYDMDCYNCYNELFKVTNDEGSEEKS